MAYRFKHRCLAIIAGIIPLAHSLSLTAIAQQQQQQQQYDPAPFMKDVPGAIYDPIPAEEQTATDSPRATAPGNMYFDSSGISYEASRAWKTDAQFADMVKIGDAKENPQLEGFTKLTLKEAGESGAQDIAGVPIQDIRLVNGLNLKQVQEVYNNGDIKIKDSLPIVQAVVGAIFNPEGAVDQLQQNGLAAAEKALINKLADNPTLKHIPISELMRGDWRGSIEKGEQVLLQQIGDKLPEHVQKIPLGSLAIDLIDGDFEAVKQKAQDYAYEEVRELTLNELSERFPELENVPIGAFLNIANAPLEEALPQLAEVAIEQIPDSEGQTLSAIPGLENTDFGAVPISTAISFLAGAVFAEFDIAHSGQDGPEEFYGRAISGGTKDQKFKSEPGIKSRSSKTDDAKKGFPRWEMRPRISGLFGSVGFLGKEWMDRVQKVPGCKGFLCILGRREPAGINPFGPESHTKFSLGETTEYSDKKATSRVYVDFQYCVYILFTEHCTAHIFSVPTPWKIQTGSLFPVFAGARLRDLFPGINPQARTVDFCPSPEFLGNDTAAGSSPPSDQEQETLYGHQAFAETTDDLYEVSSVDGVQEALTKDAAESFEQMVADAAAQGLDIKAVSGFRDKQIQQELFDAQTQRKGSPEAAAKVSAPAGHSEHHTGLAVDVGTNANPSLDTSFANTAEYAWLEKNAGNYGYELSFPEDNSQGVSFEPWHWRFVGSDQAAQAFAAASGHSHTEHSHTEHNHAESGQESEVASSAWGSPTDVNNLILTSALEGTGLQNQVDVAVSIMNRVVSPKYPNAITEVVFASGQYQPNFGSSPVNSKEEAISRMAVKAGGVEAAIAQYEEIEAALNDPQAIAASQAFLGGATDFRGEKLLHNRINGDPYRGGFGANYFLAESQDSSVAAATLGTLGVESAAVDPNGINASSVASAANCNPTLLASNQNSGQFVEGTGVSTGEFISPTTGPITSDYGWREHPKFGGTSWHTGIDYGAPTGTPIKAADGGVVVDVESVCTVGDYSCGGGYGNLVRIRHDNGFETVYAHAHTVNVRKGMRVEQGQVVATVGHTGISTGPHLHFEVRKGPGWGKQTNDLNPLDYLR